MKNFKRAYDMVPAGYQKELREKIMDLCGWNTEQTFYNKCNGRTDIRKPERPIIKAQFARFGIDALTGENINGFKIKSA